MTQQIIFGSPEAAEQLRQDKRHPNWMTDVEGYGGNAPLPEYDDEGQWIVRCEPDEEMSEPLVFAVA